MQKDDHDQPLVACGDTSQFPDPRSPFQHSPPTIVFNAPQSHAARSKPHNFVSGISYSFARWSSLGHPFDSLIGLFTNAIARVSLETAITGLKRCRTQVSIWYHPSRPPQQRPAEKAGESPYTPGICIQRSHRPFHPGQRG